jgi:acetylornithine deacetylase/succinyl-diaminopimelate desuccinylase-like protein
MREGVGMTSAPTAQRPTDENDVVQTLVDLIRIDTTNYASDDGPGERTAAEYAAERLTDAGLNPILLESAPRRANVITRWEGVDRSRPPLLIHGHLDVVPANADDWTMPPLSGEVVDDVVWGRGAVDMKHFIAQLLALVERRQREGRPPARDLLMVFTADEEHTGERGAFWLANEHPEIFEGVSEAIGEGGGFSLPLPSGRRLYTVGTGEKGMIWTKVTATGRAGHGSMVNEENAVARLTQAMARVAAHDFPITLTPTSQRMIEVLADELGVPVQDALADPEALVMRIESMADELRAMLRHMANPTMLSAGYKANVIPGSAEGVIDVRTLPGGEAEFLAIFDQLLGEHITREPIWHDAPFEGPVDGQIPDAIAAAVAAEDADGRCCPYLDVGGTDAKAFLPLGIDSYGFTPLMMPADLRYPELFHGIDERVPASALQFGVRVLDRIFSAL